VGDIPTYSERARAKATPQPKPYALAVANGHSVLMFSGFGSLLRLVQNDGFFDVPDK
jgi:hypothetical protein